MFTAGRFSGRIKVIFNIILLKKVGLIHPPLCLLHLIKFLNHIFKNIYDKFIADYLRKSYNKTM